MSSAADLAVVGVQVTAVIVAHNGERWLPRLLSSLSESERSPDQIVAVDTGSADNSARLLADCVGDTAVTQVSAKTGFGEAVSRGLTAAAATTTPIDATQTRWIWLLHDDCAPAPDTLAKLLDVAATDEHIAVVGCGIRAWPRGRRLLEVGVTITGTGHRETGLEPGEQDQGQYYAARDSLAVSSAGMLIKRSVWDALQGLAPELPLFRDDVDFGWRVVKSGHRVVVAPGATLFHAEAATRGVRKIDNSSASPHRADRRAALFTLLANCSPWVLPWQYLRLAFGSAIRAVGYLLGKLPRASYDEMAATLFTLGRPDCIIAARFRRRHTSTDGRAAARELLPPWWTPYANGIDSVMSRFAEGLRDAAGTVAASANRMRRGTGDLEPLETGPVSDDMVSLPTGAGPVSWLRAHPLLCMTGLLVFCALIASRGLWGSGSLQGGALLPAPAGASHWWHDYVSGWHPVGLGSTTVMAPYVALLAVLSSVLFGNAELTVDLLMMFAVPLAGFGAFIATRRLVHGVGLRLWMAVTYALLPVLTGAFTTGHIGTVVGAIVLPWLVRAASPLAAQSAGPGWRAAWASGLMLAILAAFVPVAWLLAVALVVVAAGWHASWTRVAQLFLAVAIPVVLLMPWAARFVSDPTLFLTEAGTVDIPGSSVTGSGWRLLFGRFSATGAAPWWLTAGLLLAAVFAVARKDRRTRVVGAWVVIAAALVTAALMSAYLVAVPGTNLQAFGWLGFPVLVAQAGAVCAVGFAADGLRRSVGSGSFGWRQPLAAGLTVFAVLAPIAGLGWWVGVASHGELVRRAAVPLPAYMVEAMATGTGAKQTPLRVLVIHTAGPVIKYQLLTDDGVRLGDDSVTPTKPSAGLTNRVTNLLVEGSGHDLSRLSGLSIGYIVLPTPANQDLVARLDGLPGLTRASTSASVMSGWQVGAASAVSAARPTPHPVDAHRKWWLIGQLVAWLIVAVLAAPALDRRLGLKLDRAPGVQEARA
ncbi:MAG: glycosyltransferase [Nocardioidaceae bacterium]